MKASLPSEPGPATLSADPEWGLVQRIAASTSFQKSPRLRKLLFHICERALQNRPEDLREQLIGWQVFDRRRDYSPGEDNIVRVEVRRLRKRLEEYFASEGIAEPVVVNVPKGCYVPVFRPREDVVEPVQAVVTAVPAVPPATRALKARLWPVIALLSAAVLVLGWWGWSTHRELAAISTSARSADRAPLWPILFNDDVQTRIVCADAALVAAQSLRGGPISLEDYIRSDYRGKVPLPAGETPRLLGSLPRLHWTDLADVRLVDRLHSVNQDAWRRISLSTARLTQIDDFTSGNAVLLGSIQSNPWNRLFEQQLNFWIDWDEKTQTDIVRNKAPRPGEARAYGHTQAAGDGSFAFSIIAFLPNLRQNGSVLIVAGTSGQGTEAAGEYITTPGTYHLLMRQLIDLNSGKLPYFEVLLKSRILGGVAKDAKIVTFRTHPR
ncbi:MAG TPA: helix-turn-helix domain-containing protein [Bryobacteraceae bacterium]|nr:helix-turn-helix domain-containing protein [Bryobacteraceae bacterium]